jgi:hypothetical protein
MSGNKDIALRKAWDTPEIRKLEAGRAEDNGVTKNDGGPNTGLS